MVFSTRQSQRRNCVTSLRRSGNKHRRALRDATFHYRNICLRCASKSDIRRSKIRVTAAVFSQAERFLTETSFIVCGMGIPEERFPPLLDDLQALTTAPKKLHPPLRHAGPHAAAHKRAEKA